MSVPRPPVKVALAGTVARLPRGAGLAYEPKFDGHRMVIFHAHGKPVLQARSGRIVTAAFPDLAEAALALPEGTVLDGEVVIWTGGRIDFAAVQRRAAATAARATLLARRLPASYAAFDLLAADGEDLRPAPYERRRERLVELLGPLGPPLQPVPMTTDPELAATWYETLPAAGVEGLVIKRLSGPYRAGARDWRKLRHTDVRDAAVVGFTGPAGRPAALVLVLPDDDTPAVSSPLPPALRTQAGALLAGLGTAAPGEPWESEGVAMAVGVGEVPYRTVRAGLTAEVEQGTTRHTVVTVLRIRDDVINQV
ncbi:ATP-dependent DNA ligase [Streptomyces sp. NPDC000410]|uniref:ATP-dependent DNA ligase n=1 Tax=Streptomyces sp. NPDC000410 TaxID=3154254 RepID=UPI003325E285